jgi:hypothetical protein
MAVDATGAVRDWVNSLTTDLVGMGNPLQLGAHPAPLRSPAKGAYAKLLRVGGSRELTVERPFDRARISATICGLTIESTAAAAAAYCTAVEALALGGAATPMGDLVVCQVVDDITGPIELPPESGSTLEYRALVDADFYLILASALTA